MCQWWYNWLEFIVSTPFWRILGDGGNSSTIVVLIIVSLSSFGWDCIHALIFNGSLSRSALFLKHNHLKTVTQMKHNYKREHREKKKTSSQIRSQFDLSMWWSSTHESTYESLATNIKCHSSNPDFFFCVISFVAVGRIELDAVQEVMLVVIWLVRKWKVKRK